MTPAAIIREAYSEGVRLTLSPAGTIKVAGEGMAVNRWIAVIRQRKAEIIDELKAASGEKTNDLLKPTVEILEQFQFDLVEQEIAAGAPVAELDRTNNLAWRFMEQEGMPFGQAIAVAASIVVACEPALGESEYTDVRSLWHELTGNQQSASTNRRES